MFPIYVEIYRQKLSINTKQHFFFIFVNWVGTFNSKKVLKYFSEKGRFKAETFPSQMV